MFYSGLLNANVDLDAYADRVRAIDAMVESMQSADWRGKTYTSQLRQLLDQDSVDLNEKLNFRKGIPY
ncbi:hypothetical protein BpHYR1_050322, partial [Brachionus plicatilis]